MAEIKALLMVVHIVAITYTGDCITPSPSKGEAQQAATTPASTTHKASNVSEVTSENWTDEPNSTATPDKESTTRFIWEIDSDNANSLTTDVQNTSATLVSDKVTPPQVKGETTPTPPLPPSETSTPKDIVNTTPVNDETTTTTTPLPPQETTTPKGSSTEIFIAASLVLIPVIIHFLM